MKNIFKTLLGLNIISFKHLLAGHPLRFLGAASKAFTAARCWTPDTDASRLPTISLDEILGDRKPQISLPVMRYEEGMLPSRDAIVLLASLVAEAPKEVLEIGTFMGHTTRLMADNCPETTIHTVDLPLNFSSESVAGSEIPKDDFHLIERRVVGREFVGKPSSLRIKQHFGDTALWDFREAGSASFFFIDGSHTYEYCKNDSEKCFDLCGGKGVFFWHDVNDLHPGVVKFVNEWRKLGRDIRRVRDTDLGYWKSI
jgi:hypothetical protein